MVYLDVMDAVQLLFLLKDPSGQMTKSQLQHGVVAVACLNLILPTFVLAMSLCKCSDKCLKIWKFVYSLTVNLSMVIVRASGWHQQSGDVSVFLVKNVVVLLIILKELWRLFVQR